MKNFLTTFLVLISYTFYAQKHEVGISVLSYAGNRNNTTLTDTATAYSKGKGNDIQPVLTYNYITAKNIDFYLQAGYFHMQQKGFDKYTGSSTIGYNSIHVLSKSVYIKFGAAKRFETGKLLLIAGVNIPFEYNFYHVENDFTNEYINNDLVYHREFYSNQPPIYTTGVNLQISFYYNITKNLSLGADLNLGYKTTIYNGEQNYKNVYTYYDTPALNYTDEQTVYYKKTSYNSLNFQPSIGIRYCFLKKKSMVVTP
jgi:hypothetical protein